MIEQFYFTRRRNPMTGYYQSGARVDLGVMANKEVFYIRQISRTGVSPSDSVQSHTQDIPLLKIAGVLPVSAEDTVNIF